MTIFKAAQTLLTLTLTAQASNRLSDAFRFEPNVGQAGRDVLFLARGPGHSLTLTSTTATFRNGASTLTMHFIGADPAAEPVGLDPLASRAHYLIGGREN